MIEFSDYKIITLENGKLGLQRAGDSKIVEHLDVELAKVNGDAILRLVLVADGDSNLHRHASEDGHISEIRDEMQEWLDRYMTVTKSIDLAAGVSASNALEQAINDLGTRRDAFLSGDHTPLSARWQLYWNSADGQGSVDGLDYDTRQDAERGCRQFAEELLKQCSSDEGDDILAGEMMLIPMVGSEQVGEWITTRVHNLVETEQQAA